jgi:DNA-binding transcriptional LysR family regulator
MDLRHLRYFVNVAETASVSKAALRVHISQPALSRQIHDLEIELGLRLFDRVGRRIRLTPEGEDLLERSRDVLARAEAIRERARELTAGVVGRLRVGATSQIFQSVMAGMLAEYRRSRPSIEVTLIEAGGVRLLDLVAHGDLDLAVGGILPGARFGGRLLFPIRLLAIAAAGRRWKQRATIEVVDLADEPLLLLNRDFGTRQLFDAACRITHIRPQGVMESNEVHSLIALAEAGPATALPPVGSPSGKNRSAGEIAISGYLFFRGVSSFRPPLFLYHPGGTLTTHRFLGFTEGIQSFLSLHFSGGPFQKKDPAAPELCQNYLTSFSMLLKCPKVRRQ